LVVLRDAYARYVAVTRAIYRITPFAAPPAATRTCSSPRAAAAGVGCNILRALPHLVTRLPRNARTHAGSASYCYYRTLRTFRALPTLYLLPLRVLVLVACLCHATPLRSGCCRSPFTPHLALPHFLARTAFCNGTTAGTALPRFTCRFGYHTAVLQNACTVCRLPFTRLFHAVGYTHTFAHTGRRCRVTLRSRHTLHRALPHAAVTPRAHARPFYHYLRFAILPRLTRFTIHIRNALAVLFVHAHGCRIATVRTCRLRAHTTPHGYLHTVLYLPPAGCCPHIRALLPAHTGYTRLPHRWFLLRFQFFTHTGYAWFTVRFGWLRAYHMPLHMRLQRTYLYCNRWFAVMPPCAAAHTFYTAPATAILHCLARLFYAHAYHILWFLPHLRCHALRLVAVLLPVATFVAPTPPARGCHAHAAATHTRLHWTRSLVGLRLDVLRFLRYTVPPHGLRLAHARTRALCVTTTTPHVYTHTTTRTVATRRTRAHAALLPSGFRPATRFMAAFTLHACHYRVPTHTAHTTCIHGCLHAVPFAVLLRLCGLRTRVHGWRRVTVHAYAYCRFAIGYAYTHCHRTFDIYARTVRLRYRLTYRRLRYAFWFAFTAVACCYLHVLRGLVLPHTTDTTFTILRWFRLQHLHRIPHSSYLRFRYTVVVYVRRFATHTRFFTPGSGLVTTP